MKQFTLTDFNNSGFRVTTGNAEWKFEGKSSCILTFTSEWCQPCKQLHNYLEDIQIMYPKVQVYVIDVEEQYELTDIFEIKDLPTTILCPINNKPYVITGKVPYSKLEEIIRNIFKIEPVMA